ncbi:MAG TPA: alpha/beta fold hydrolase [Gemmatimonadaceae bacterium]|nr:alpha/beta fold hydrolase [Gemmatimonadaceae bacterium]
MSEAHHLPVRRTARYYTSGDVHPGIDEVWFVCHGYGQLASDFLKEFDPIANEKRLIIAPEALSRYYIASGPGFHGPDAKVGATWMTREDRDAEIADYVTYLDTLYDEIMREIDRERVRVTVVGFSQGGATANRWLTRGNARADRLLMWGSLLASDADLEQFAEFFRNVELVIVYGVRDQFGDPAMMADYEQRLKASGISYKLVTFNGGHRMDRDTLRLLAEPG